MSVKLILIALTFILISFYLLVIIDMYLLPSVSREDVMTNIQIADSGKLTGDTRYNIIVTESGEHYAVLMDTDIVFQQRVPVTIHSTPILHKPLDVDFAQSGTIQHMDSLYLNQSYAICFLLFVLSIINIVCVLQWSKGKAIRKIYLFTFIILFTALLSFQYFKA